MREDEERHRKANQSDQKSEKSVSSVGWWLPWSCFTCCA